MAGQGALAGLRVLDLTDELGRFATKLFAEAGADVVKIAGRGAPGAPMRDPVVAARGGLLDWWFDGGKHRVAIDLDSASGQEAVRALAARADVVIDDAPPGWLAERGIDHPQLSAANGRLVHASLTHWQASAASAASDRMSVWLCWKIRASARASRVRT